MKEDHTISFENKIFNLFCYVAIGYALLSIPISIYAEFNYGITLFYIATIIVFSSAFYLNKKWSNSKKLIIPIIVFLIIMECYFWFNLNGLLGSTTLLFVLTFVIFTLLLQSKQQVAILTIITLPVFFLFSIEVFNPELISSYKNNETQKIDYFITIMVGVVVISIFLYQLKYAYEELFKKYGYIIDDLQFSENKIKISNAKLDTTNIRLSKYLDEKELLIKEIHHRVKNNLQIASNMLALQEIEHNDPRVSKALYDSRLRLKSMSTLHELLYQSNDYKAHDVKDYINRLVENLLLNQNDILNVKFELLSDLYLMSTQTLTTLGLMLNELITNSIKYAFTKNNARPKVIISIQCLDKATNKFEIIYADNGPGLPSNYDFSKSTSLGMGLIYSLSEQMNGNVKYNYVNKLSTFTINFTSDFIDY